MFTKRNDDELITAYLDGQLDARAKRGFEARINADAALRQRVDVTRQLVQAARQTPAVSAPRSFTLPRTVQVQQPAAAPHMMWRFASALAAAVFVIALGLDVSGTLRPAMPASAPAPAMMVAAATNAAPPAGAPAAQAEGTATAEPMLQAAPDENATPPAPGISAKRMTSDTSTAEMAPLAAGAEVSITEPMTMTAMMAQLPEATSEVTPTMEPTPQPAMAAQTNEAAPDISLIARIVAGVALVIAIAAGMLGWRRPQK